MYYITAIDNQNPPNESTPSDTISVTPTSSAAPSTPSELGRSGDYIRPTFFFTNANSFNIGSTLTYQIQNQTLASRHSVQGITFGNSNDKTIISGDTLKVTPNITASGAISASGNFDNFLGGKLHLNSATAGNQQINFGGSARIQGNDTYY